MDRLIVGDVGFGKTEVAMRAAFIAAMSGVQVAGHRADDAARTAAFQDLRRPLPGHGNHRPTALALRLGPATRHQTREGLAEGSVDIVIGTHAVLAKQVKFRNLALLVIDEEQHFGVAHKERFEGDAVGDPCPDPDRHTDPEDTSTVAHRCP